MDNKNSEIEGQGKSEINYKEGYITLPVTPEQFKDFISGLFGKPEILERAINGSFQIELGDIINFYYVLENRISEQNKGVLVQFSVKFFFDDNSSITINSFDKLNNYVESRYIVPIRAELNWQYLIKFNDRDNLEKQEIELYIYTKSFGSIEKSYPARSLLINSGFFLKIKYTARTWATDIDSMLNDHIKNLINIYSPDKSIRKYQNIVKNKSLIATIFGFILFSFSTVVSFVVSQKFTSTKVTEIISQLNKINDSNNKIDLLASFIAKGESLHFYFFLAIFLIIMAFISIASAIFIGFQLSDENIYLRKRGILYKSYILITKKAIEEQKKDIKKANNERKNFFISIVIAILVNIFSNFIFVYLTTK